MALGLTTSCEDEVIDRMVEIPGDTVTVLGFNHIVSFQVKEFSADTVLEAAIDEDSLIVYWPSYRPLPETIAPEIIVANGATVTPASGESVSFTTGTLYTVHAEDKRERQYILKVVIYQPKPIYVTGDQVVEIEIALDNTTGVPAQFFGDYFIPDTVQTNLYMINWTSEEETKMKITSITPTRLEINIPQDFPKGYYRTSLKSGIHTISRQDSLWVKFPAPRITWVSFDLVALKQGETFELPGTNLFDLESVALSTSSGFIEWEIVSYTPNSIILKIPIDFPTGDYFLNQFIVTSPNGESLGNVFMLKVTPG